MSRSPRAGKEILAAIVDLTNIGQPVRRQVLSQVTQYTLSVVDFHLKSMASDGVLHRLRRGEYELVDQGREDRAISHTVLPDGSHKLEIGDTCMDLTTREARTLGWLLSGISIQFAVSASAR